MNGEINSKEWWPELQYFLLLLLLAPCLGASFLLALLGFKKAEQTLSLTKETVEGWGVGGRGYHKRMASI